MVAKTFQGVTKTATAIELGFTGLATVPAVKEDGFVKGIAKQIPSMALYAAMPSGWAQLAYMGVTLGYDMLLNMGKANAENQKNVKNLGSGYAGSGYFNMSGAGYTMRQRAVNKMHETGMNINSVLGNEARNYIGSSRKAW